MVAEGIRAELSFLGRHNLCCICCVFLNSKTYGLKIKQFPIFFQPVVLARNPRFERSKNTFNILGGFLTFLKSCILEITPLSHVWGLHGHRTIERPDHDLKGRDKIELIPNHGCTTIPLYDHYFIIRNNYVESWRFTPAARISGEGTYTSVSSFRLKFNPNDPLGSIRWFPLRNLEKETSFFRQLK